MKVRLDVNDRTLTMVSPDELIHFTDEFQARAFLRIFATDPNNLHTLRQLLGQEIGQFTVSGLTEDEVLEQVARLISRTCVGLVRVELRDMISADQAGAEQGLGDDDPEETPLSEDESELEELKPEPQIPPLFPIIAKMEINGLHWERRLYNVRLDLMRYSGLEDPGESELAPSLVEVAQTDATALVENAEGFSLKLLGVADPANLLHTQTELGDKLVATAEETGGELVGLTDNIGQIIGKRLLEINPPPPSPSSLAPYMQDFSQTQGDAVTRITASHASVLGERLLKNDGEPPAPSQMATLLQDFSKTQGEGVAAAAKRAAKVLGQASDDLNEPVSLPTMEGAETLAAMNASVEETGKGVIAATRGVAQDLSRFMSMTPAQGSEDGSGGSKLDGDGANLSPAQGNAAQGDADPEAPKLSPLAALTKKALADIQPPAWTRTKDGVVPKTLEALHSSLIEQTGGVLKATLDAVNYMRRLVPPLAAQIEDDAAQFEADGDAQGQRGSGGAVDELNVPQPGADGLDASMELGRSTVTNADGVPSLRGTEIKRSVLDQSQQIVDLTTKISASFTRLAPPTTPRAAPTAPAPVLREAHPRPEWVMPDPPATPEWTPPEVEVPEAFGGVGPEAHFEARLNQANPDRD